MSFDSSTSTPPTSTSLPSTPPPESANLCFFRFSFLFAFFRFFALSTSRALSSATLYRSQIVLWS